MKSEEYIQLYEKYLSGTCTREEEDRLFGYKDGFRMYEEAVSAEDKALRRDIYRGIRKEIFHKKATVVKLWWKYAAAVLLVLSVGVAIYWNVLQKEPQLDTHVVVPVIEAVPVIDSNSVTLTLANGEVVSLDSIGNGLLSGEGSTRISKVGDMELVYKQENDFVLGHTAMNTLYVPKGGQYKLTLADGTTVWLNANSTLYYPARFEGVERTVELSGEAYFEVAKNEKMPFVVKTRKTKVQVLGTHFNISAYGDEDVERITLTEGSVKVLRGEHATILKPGQQGIVKGENSDIWTRQVDVRKILAWKEGVFIFKDDPIREVMRQVSGWYDVDVVYQTETEGKSFGGIYSRSKDLEELLKGLELTGTVKFKIEGRRVIVMD